MIEKNLILDYELIRGLPAEVAFQVQELIGSCKGWQPKGELIKIKLGDNDVLVQCMVKYES